MHLLVCYPRKIDYNDRVARLHGYDVRVPFDVAWAGFRTTVSWQVGKQTCERSKAGKLAMRDWNVSRPFEPFPTFPPLSAPTLLPPRSSAPVLAPASDFLFSLLLFAPSLSRQRCFLILSSLSVGSPACKVAASNEKERERERERGGGEQVDAWHYSGKERNSRKKERRKVLASDGVNLQ